jgi:hypothetical protein
MSPSDLSLSLSLSLSHIQYADYTMFQHHSYNTHDGNTHTMSDTLSQYSSAGTKKKYMKKKFSKCKANIAG